MQVYRIRVYFINETFTTLSIHPNTTVQQLVANINRKRPTQTPSSSHQLFVIDTNPFLSLTNKYIRVLSSKEYVYYIYEALLHYGHLHHVKFVYADTTLHTFKQELTILVGELAEEEEQEGKAMDKSHSEEMKVIHQQVVRHHLNYQIYEYMELLINPNLQKKRKQSKWKEYFVIIKSQQLCIYKAHTNSIAYKTLHLSHCVSRMLSANRFQVISPSLHIIFRLKSPESLHSWLSTALQFSVVEQYDNSEFIKCQYLIDEIESRKYTKLDENYKSIYHYEYFMQQTNLLSYFMRHLKNIHSEENLMFYNELQALKRLDPVTEKQKVFRECKRVYLTYLDKSAPFRILIQGKDMQFIKEYIMKNNLQVLQVLLSFDPEMYYLLKDVFYNTFMISVEFKQLLLGLSVELEQLDQLIDDTINEYDNIQDKALLYSMMDDSTKRYSSNPSIQHPTSFQDS